MMRLELVVTARRRNLQQLRYSRGKRMCWNVEASTTVAALEFVATGYAAYRKEAPALWAPLGYFSIMEALQAYAYLVLNDCTAPVNQLVTYFSYLHIVFQPFFVNAISLYFIPAPVAQKSRPGSTLSASHPASSC